MSSTPRGMSSSARDANPSCPQSLLELGKALVRELDLEQSNDILGRWMAHHLASLITAAREAASEQKVECEERCRAAILDVWRHRNCLPEGCRPFEPLESVLDTLGALDPDAERPLYYRAVLQFENFDDFDLPGDPPLRKPDYLEKARRFDSTARAVIGHLIALAVEAAPDKTQEWVRLAKEAKLDAPDVALTVRLVRAMERIAPERRADIDLVTRTLRSRLSEMDEFLDRTKEIRDDLADRLARAEAETGSADASS